MGVQQFGRKVSLIVGQSGGEAIDLSDLRIVFRVQRGDKQTPNSLRARIFNLSSNTAQRIKKEFTRVVLQAGYGGNFGIVFVGELKQAIRGRASQTDTFLDLICADGDSAYNYSFCNTTLAAGSTVADHVNVATQAMSPYGVTQGYIGDLPKNPLPRGKVFFGLARDFMRGAGRNAQATWSIQNGTIQMVPETSYKPGEVIEINSDTGMVGLPQQTANGVTFKALLNPYLKIGQLVRLNNGSIQQYEYSLNMMQVAENDLLARQIALDADGLYCMMSVSHWGDTYSEDYFSEAICLAADVTQSAKSFQSSVVVAPENVIPSRL